MKLTQHARGSLGWDMGMSLPFLVDLVVQMKVREAGVAKR
jgi:hypothetical protein